MRLDAKAIMGAVATIVKEDRAKQAAINDELRATITTLEARIEAIEQRGPSRSLRAVNE
jgi:cell division protein FtsB